MNKKTQIKILFLSLFFAVFMFTIFYSKLFSLALNVTSNLIVVDKPVVTVHWAIPEARIGLDETNDDTTFFLSIRDPISHGILYNSSLYNTANDGSHMALVDFESSISGGASYDIGFKGKAHLTKILRSVYLQSGLTNLNFTQADNSITKGPIRLIAGDVNGDGLTPATMGDDVINSVDLSYMLSDLDADDPTGNVIRSNVNQDPVVNSVDLSLMLANLDKEGDR